MNSINKNGCSVCAAGSENYTVFYTRLNGKKVKAFQYDYRTEDGELFSCVDTTLEKCVKRRDEWLNK